MTTKPTGDHADLLRVYFESTEPPAGCTEHLSVRLATDPELARAFAREAVLDRGLREAARFASARAEGASVARVARWPVRREVLVAGLAAVAAAVAVITYTAWSPAEGRPAQAILTASSGAVWASAEVATALRSGDLPAGPLRLDAGTVEFLFPVGATAIVRGPAVFEPVGADRLSVREGVVVCRCPTEQARLVLDTPTTRVTDLGTEFAVAVDPDAQTHVSVLDGSVRVDSGGRSEVLRAGDARVLDRAGESRPDPAAGELAHRIADPAAPPADAENLLADPGFESRLRPANGGRGGPGGWTSTARTDTVPGEGRGHGTAVRLRSLGRRVWTWVEQAVPADGLAGRQVTASAWVCQPAADLMTGGQNAIVKIEFCDAAGRLLSFADRHVLRANGPVGVYVPGRVTGVAPPGTALVRFQVLLYGDGLPGGSVLFDDARLAVAPTK